MYTSTKNYVKKRMAALTKQCDISLEDLQTALDELKKEQFELARQMFIESSKITPEVMEELIEFNKDLRNLSFEVLNKKITI